MIAGLKRKIDELIAHQTELQYTLLDNFEPYHSRPILKLLHAVFVHDDWHDLTDAEADAMDQIRCEIRVYTVPEFPRPEHMRTSMGPRELSGHVQRNPSFLRDFGTLLRMNRITANVFPWTHEIKCYRSATSVGINDHAFPPAMRHVIDTLADGIAAFLNPAATSVSTNDRQRYPPAFWHMFCRPGGPDMSEVCQFLAFAFFGVFTVDVKRWIHAACANPMTEDVVMIASVILCMMTEERDLVLMAKFYRRRYMFGMRGDVSRRMRRRKIWFGLREGCIQNDMVMDAMPIEYAAKGLSIYEAGQIAAGRSVNFTRAMMNRDIRLQRSNALPHLPDELWQLIYDGSQRDLSAK